MISKNKTNHTKIAQNGLFICFIYSFFFVFPLFAQPSGLDCENNDNPGNTACEATTICDFDGYCGRTDASYTANAWSELKQAIKDETIDAWGFDWLTIENDSYLTFIASSTTITFNVYVYDCYGAGTKAIQVVFFKADQCDGGPVEVVYANQEMAQQGAPHDVTVTGLVPGEVYYILIDGYSNKDCGYTFEAVEGVEAPGVAIDVGSEIIVCEGETIEVTATGGEGEFAWDGPSGLSSTSGAEITITAPNTPGNYTYTVETPGGNEFCPNNSSAELTVIVEDCEIDEDCTPPILQTSNLSTCDETSVDLNDAITNSGQGDISFHTSTNDAEQGQNAINSTVTTDGSYWIRIEDPNDSDCYAVQEITVSIGEMAPPVLSSPQDFCYQATINDLEIEGTNIKWYDEAGNTLNSFTLLEDGTTYYATQSSGGCESEQVSVTVSVGGFDLVVHPGNSTILPGDEVNLEADVTPETGNETYSWTPANRLSCTDCSNPTASPTESTTYTVTVTSEDGCEITEKIHINVVYDCGEYFIPDMFSPNNDGRNDRYRVYGEKECVEDYSLQIFDRWGTVLFETGIFTDSWEGRYKEKKLNSGVYIYRVYIKTIEGKTIHKSGNLNLLR